MSIRPMGLAVQPPIARLEDEIREQLQRLVDAESWDERGQDRVFMQWAWRIARWSMDDTVSWCEALVEVPYAWSWNDETIKRLIRDGDDAELGLVIREAMIREFASNVFSATEKAWDEGIEP